MQISPVPTTTAAPQNNLDAVSNPTSPYQDLAPLVFQALLICRFLSQIHEVAYQQSMQSQFHTSIQRQQQNPRHPMAYQLSEQYRMGDIYQPETSAILQITK